MMRARRVPRGAARCWLVRHDISMQSRGEAAHLMPVTWLLGRTLPGCEGVDTSGMGQAAWTGFGKPSGWPRASDARATLSRVFTFIFLATC